MKNFDQGVLRTLKEESNKLYQAHADSNKWVKSYLKFEEQEELSLRLKKSKADIHKITNTIEAKPVFAIFGLSQVGKSYLVQNVLSVDAEPLQIQVGSKKIEFLGNINPVGGQSESTGVVSRFTIDKTVGTEQFPIKAKIFDAKDIVTILADAYFSDVGKIEEYTTKEAFKERLSQLKNTYLNKPKIQDALTEDDIWNTARYFKQNFNTYVQYVKEIEQSGFWLELGQFIHAIPPKQWSSVFELIWNSDQELTKMFNTLISTLEILNFSETIYLSEDAILRDKGAVLDVDTLKGLINHTEEYPIQLPNENLVNIEISKLSALISEVTLCIPEEIASTKTFLKNTDLLDFPGARSRENFDAEEIYELVAVKMFLRGKVSFLFNSYSAGFEINNLLFCVKDEKIEVNTISDLIHDWIVRNVGSNIEERDKNIGKLPTCPLFVVFTFFNRQLYFDTVNDNKDVSYKWDNRFRKFFEEQITFKYGWHKNWTTTQKNFNNFYLLRDFKYSQDTFDALNGQEIKIHQHRLEHWNNLKTSFLRDAFVQQHFEDPSKSWDEAALPGKDGSDEIINALLPAANNFVKTSNFCNILESYRTELVDKLKGYVISDDIQTKRNQAFKKATDIEFELLRLFQVSEFSFTKFIKDLSLNEVNVYNLIHQNYIQTQRRKEPENYSIFRDMFPEISGELPLESNLKIIANRLMLDSTSAAEAYLADKGIDLTVALENRVLTSASKLVDLVLDEWRNVLNLNRLTHYVDLGLDKNALDQLIENLLETFQRLNVRNELIILFEQKTRLIHAPIDTEEYLASIITEYINDFVSNFGFNFMKDDRLEELLSIAQIYQQDMTLITRVSKEDKEAQLLEIYNKLDSIDNVSPPLRENFRLFILKMKLAMLSNCGFVTYDMQQNDSLKELIHQLNEIRFSLN
jgi:hypothetical protein